MKILKRVLLAILIIIALPFIVALFVPRDFSVSREVVIAKPRAEVFAYIGLLKNQNYYSKWARLDPNMKQTFTGEDGKPGFISAWEGNKDVGKGQQEIIAVRDGEVLETKISFKEPFESQANGILTTADAGPGQTRVSWTFKGRSPWPFNLMSLFMDKSIGNDLETGLNNLKHNLETGDLYPAIK